MGVTLESVTLEMLGSAERVVVGKEGTTIVTDGKQTDAIAKRIAQIRREVAGTDSQFDTEKVRCRRRRRPGWNPRWALLRGKGKWGLGVQPPTTLNQMA